jgi:hypothetical protein
MASIDTRLERGVAIFRRAGDDPALLGAALLAFHGALERFLDDEITGQPDLGAPERELLSKGRLGWPTRAELATRYGLLAPEQRDRALRAARARLVIARGDEFGWSAEEVAAYGRLAASTCGRMELIGKVDQRAERAKATAARQAPPVWVVPQERWQFSWARLGATLVFLAVLVGAAWLIFTQFEGPRILRAIGALPAPTAIPTEEVAPPTATPPAASARMVGLGGGPGWLHVTPSFDSPTRPPRLAEGMTVTPRDETQVDANGLTWRLVEVAGYEGWVPEGNLVIESP